MARLNSTRGAQMVMSAEFVFNYNDTKLDVNGVEKSFGSVYTDAIVTEVIKLPQGAVIVGGDLIVETAGVGPTAYTAALGTAASASGLLAATSLLATGRTALTGLGLLANDGSNIQLTIASTVANATAGKFRVRVEFVIDKRVNEAYTN